MLQGYQNNLSGGILSAFTSSMFVTIFNLLCYSKAAQNNVCIVLVIDMSLSILNASLLWML